MLLLQMHINQPQGLRLPERVPWAMPKLQNKQVIGRGAAFSPEGEAGAPALKMAMLDD